MNTTTETTKPSAMIWAHQGLATDNTLTRDVDNSATRSFRCFATEEAFLKAQASVWESTAHCQNLIRCDHTDAFRFLGADGMEALKNEAIGNKNGFELQVDGKKIGVFATRKEANDYADYSTSGYEEIYVVETLEKPNSTFGC